MLPSAALRRPALFVLLLLTLLASPLDAQDFVFLADGTRLRGDVVLWGDELVMVMRDGSLKRIPAGDVKRTKRKPLSAPVAERLGPDTVDLKHLYRVGCWAMKDKRLMKDGQRLLGRVVALDPKHERAREALGHVFFIDRWYEKPHEPYKKMKDKMKADGYRWHQKAWVKKELLPQVKASPEKWMKYRGLVWRLVDEVRTERGDRHWEGEWYVEKDAPRVKALKRIKNIVGDGMHVARVGECLLYGALRRDQVEKLAARQDQARRWFIKTFNLHDRAPYLLKEPILIDYVFSSKALFDKAIDTGYMSDEMAKLPKGLSMNASGRKIAKQLGSFCTTPFYGTNRQTKLFQWRLVSSMGLRMLDLFWLGAGQSSTKGGYSAAGHQGSPAWLKVACAHHAEIAVLKEVRVLWVHPGSYGVENQLEFTKGRNMKQIRQDVKKAWSNEPIPSLRLLMMKTMNDLNLRLDLLGTVYLQFLLENHRKPLIAFLREPVGNQLRQRFEKHFKMTYEALHREFLTWLG